MVKKKEAYKAKPLNNNKENIISTLIEEYDTHYDNWDGATYDLGKFQESFITSKDVRKYVDEVTQKNLDDCKKKKRCFECGSPLSMLGKCKNQRCDKFNVKVFQ